MKVIVAIIVGFGGSVIGGAIGCLLGMIYGAIKAFNAFGIEIELPTSNDSSKEKDQI